jgi:hypothetical protein
VIYVGDNAGKLHKFINIFVSGTPAESGSPFATVHSGSFTLTGPIYDPTTTNAFVGDNAGYVYAVNSGGTVTTSGQIGKTGSLGIVDAPYLDYASGTTQLYAFVADDNNGSGGAVYQFPTASFAANTTGNKVAIGTASTTVAMYAGSFDNEHYNNGQGNLYVCGYTTHPVLYQIAMPSSYSFAASTVNTFDSTVATATATCTPVSEVLQTGATTTTTQGITTTSQTQFTVTSTSGMTANSTYIQISNEIMKVTGISGSQLTVTRGWDATPAATYGSGATVTIVQDLLFLSTTTAGGETGTSCHGSTTACLYSYSVLSLAATGTAAAGIAATGGATGTIIDNFVISSPTGGSNIYYLPLGSATCTGNGASGAGTGMCGTQISQTGL